ncbi:hypothetical protein C9J21_21785, partial [Photobacterium phosphoreum]
AEAETKRLADEAEAKAEAETKRLADEAEAKAEAETKRLADEAEAKAEAETKRLADEAEAQRLVDEAEAQRLVDEAEAQRLVDEAEDQRLDEEAEAQRLVDEAEDQRLDEEAEAQRLDEEADAQWEELDTAWEVQYKEFILSIKKVHSDINNITDIVDVADIAFRNWLENQNISFNDFNEARLQKAKNFVNKKVEKSLSKNSEEQACDYNKDQQHIVDEVEYDFSLLSPEILTLIQNATHIVEDENTPEALIELLDALESPLELAYIKKTLKDLDYEFDL